MTRFAAYYSDSKFLNMRFANVNIANYRSQEHRYCRIEPTPLLLATMSVVRSSFISGLKGVLPILIWVIPFGMIYGVLALEAGLSAVQTQASSIIVFAGLAQFVMVQLFDAQASAVGIGALHRYLEKQPMLPNKERVLCAIGARQHQPTRSFFFDSPKKKEPKKKARLPDPIDVHF